MISCRLQGGLGNQMFQISAAYALALRNNDAACFNLSVCNTPMQGNKSITYVNSIFSKICDSKNLNFEILYNEPNFSFNEIKYSPNMLLNGFFQSEKYFYDFKEEIKNLFNLPTDIVKKPIDKLTSIHVRRGDYLKLQDYHLVLPKEYYLEAMDKIKGNFIFFSDDIEWVKENFKGDNIFYSETGDELMDLTLMSLCDNNIIANSSFSWWGAYLNKNKNKKVIAPKNWFGPNGPTDINDIYPETWEKI